MTRVFTKGGETYPQTGVSDPGRFPHGLLRNNQAPPPSIISASFPPMVCLNQRPSRPFSFWNIVFSPRRDSQPGGMPAISRGLREATPPVSNRRPATPPEGAGEVSGNLLIPLSSRWVRRPCVTFYFPMRVKVVRLDVHQWSPVRSL